MNTQNTPVHVSLWHREFWYLAFANLLLTMGVYMLIPTLPEWMLASTDSSLVEVGCAMGAFGVGLFLLGPFCSYLVQEHRRGRMCLMAMLGVLLALGLIYLLSRQSAAASVMGARLCALHVQLSTLLLGACFGLAQMILSSTLIIDTSESFQRTEANHSASWFGRFALSLGPLLGLFLEAKFGFSGMIVGAMVCVAASVVLLLMVHFPFRTPEEGVRLFSLDRFFLPQGVWLFLNLFIITTVVGIVLSTCVGFLFYAMLMAGFFMALLAQRFAFRDAELKSEVVSGLLLMGCAVLMLTGRQQTVTSWFAPLLFGMGVGLIGSRFLLFFIKLSRHCQRGTSQSSYMLAWESGIAFGLFLGYTFFYGQQEKPLYVALGLCALALAIYSGFVHSWFMNHKNR